MFNNSHANKKTSLLNINELNESLKSIDGDLYWFRKTGQKYISSKEIAQKRWLRRLIKKRIQKGRAKPELSMYGSTMVRDFWPFGGSLNFESSLKSGWERKYCDEYQGLWVNLNLSCYALTPKGTWFTSTPLTSLRTNRNTTGTSVSSTIFSHD